MNPWHGHISITWLFCVVYQEQNRNFISASDQLKTEAETM